MSFEKGTLAVTFFKLEKSLPENALDIFAARKAKKLDDLRTEEDMGWVSGRHLLERRIDEGTAICAGHYYLNLRNAQRKIPTALLNAECRMAELNFMQENNLDFVPAKMKKEIRQNIEQMRLPSMPPQISGIPFVIDKRDDILYLGTASPKSIELFCEFFFESFQIEPVQITLEDILMREFNEVFEALPEICFSESAKNNDFMPAWDFLTWLWYYSETQNEGSIEVKDFGPFNIYIDGPLTFAFIDDVGGGAVETALKKGSPQKSAEAKIALQIGKKLKKSKLYLTSGNVVWNTAFDPAKFAFTGMTLPDGEEMDLHSKFEERINFLNTFRVAMEEYFKVFVKIFLGDDSKSEIKKLQKWVNEKESV
jgi:hypothetical protein